MVQARVSEAAPVAPSSLATVRVTVGFPGAP